MDYPLWTSFWYGQRYFSDRNDQSLYPDGVDPEYGILRMGENELWRRRIQWLLELFILPNRG